MVGVARCVEVLSEVRLSKTRHEAHEAHEHTHPLGEGARGRQRRDGEGEERRRAKEEASVNNAKP